MGFQQSTRFGKHLGFPIMQGKIAPEEFQFIIDNLHNKLSGWKTRFLNIAGRTTLAKSCLSNIPTHIKQLHKLPVSITNKIDKIQCNFIWGTTKSKRKMHMINWDIITEEKELGA